MNEQIHTLPGRQAVGSAYDVNPGDVAHVRVTREDGGRAPWELRVHANGAVTHEWKLAGDEFNFQLVGQFPRFRVSVASEEALSVEVQVRDCGPDGWLKGGKPVEPAPIPAPPQDLGEPPVPAEEFAELASEVEGLT